MSAAPEVFVGTSGYSFADWAGPFYPPATARADYLNYYASQFTCVEVNSTYYGIPHPSVIARMEQKTPAGFRFIVKLNHAMTHEYASGPEPYARLLEAVQPLKDAGKFHGLLAQFPWACKRDERSKAHLERLRERLPGEPLWVEFRHSSWMHPKLPEWLAQRELGYCCVDEPALPGLVPPVTHVTNGLGYVRFHGRNAQHWWGRGARTTATEAAGRGTPARSDREQLRYDYDYPECELQEWVTRVRALAQQAKQTYLFFNNCHAGQAARNAKLMEELLRRAPPLS
jgi:uncharacterized protein YecE (DUF72 family)